MLARIQQSAVTTFTEAGAEIVGDTPPSAPSSRWASPSRAPSRRGTCARKGGARSGDALILTRALGTGTILAALMAQARLPAALLGEAVALAFAQMTRAPAPPARLLAPHAPP